LPEFRSINWIPAFNAKETLLNFLAFSPIGLYLGMLLKDKEKKSAWLKSVLFISLLSLLFEVTQYILALGTSDITDLITNTLGGMAGFAFYFAIRKRMGEKTDRAFITLGSIGTILLSAFWVIK
jgi:glycopeptide antibiotics resistance protein